jgi:hypothetical protein
MAFKQKRPGSLTDVAQCNRDHVELQAIMADHM